MKGTELQDTGYLEEQRTGPMLWCIPSSIGLSHKLRAEVLLAAG